MGDLDTKMGTLDVEPIDRDIRMMSVAVETISKAEYAPNNKIQVVMGIFLLVMVIVSVLGVGYSIKKQGDNAKQYNSVITNFEKIANTQSETMKLLIDAGFKPSYTYSNVNTPSGLAPAPA